MSVSAGTLTWRGTLRLALVQMAIGAIVVLATSTLNRIMVVEIHLPSSVPAALVALHYLVQLVRLHHGYRVDVGGRCVPRILAGMVLLAGGCVGASWAVGFMPTDRALGISLALAAYLAIGIGVGAAGTANLTLLTKRLAPQRRAMAAALVWIMMIAGFAVSAGVAGHILQPFAMSRLPVVFLIINGLAVALAWFAVRGMEPRKSEGTGSLARMVQREAAHAGASSHGFAAACRQLWSDAAARRFTLFLFTSMFAFSGQELLLEPFAGVVFGWSPAQSARLAGTQNTGVVIGMLVVVLAAALRKLHTEHFARRWMIAGTLSSAAMLSALALVAMQAQANFVTPVVFALGLSNGLFAVAAIGVMMDLSAGAGTGREGLYMGMWGASQALAFAFGGITAGALIDSIRHYLGTSAGAYSAVLIIDAALFALACSWASRLRAVPLAVPRGIAAAPQS